MEDENAEEEDPDNIPKDKSNKQVKPKKFHAKSRAKKAERTERKNDKDYELFLRDLEDDPELRKDVNLYKVS